MADDLKLKVILGSTREGRIGRKVADWVVEGAEKQGDFEVELLDLADFDLPFLYEPTHPAMQQGKYNSPEVQNWADKVADGDAFVIVTPEYNYGYPGVLKNALDLLHPEWGGKPVGFVGYSAVSSAGVRAVGQLLPVVMNLSMVPVSPSTQLGNLKTQDNDELDLTAYDERLQATLASVLRLTKGLKSVQVAV